MINPLTINMEFFVMEKSAKIALLNDNFRNTLEGGLVLVTKEFDELSDELKSSAIEKIREFSDFSVDNDPYCEHDVAIVRLESLKKAFKFHIDYYDKGDNNLGAETPEDAEKTLRVMTISLVSYIE
jgi:hypothetical protein